MGALGSPLAFPLGADADPDVVLVAPPTEVGTAPAVVPTVATHLPRDFALDSNGDLDLSTGDATYTTGMVAIAQALDLAFSLVKGEWFADLDAGVDSFGVVLVSNPSQELIKQELRTAAFTVPGVTGVTSISLTLDRVARELTGAVNVSTDEGDIAQEVRLAA